MHQTFCVVPFLGGCIRPDGKVKACCQSLDAGSADYTEVVQWFTSDDMNKLRKDLYSGVEHPWCQRCWNAQDIGHESQREMYNKGLYSAEVKEIIQQSVANDFAGGAIKFLDLKLGNLCNLKCVMCDPSSSSKIMSEWKQHKDWFPIQQYDGVDYTWPERQEFSDAIANILPHLKYAKFTGGEPFLNPYINNILDLLPSDCVVHFTTNLTILDDQKIQLLQKFKDLWLTASVDAVGDLYEAIRYPAKWATVERNVATVLNKLPNARFTFSATVSALSILQIDKTLNTLTEHVGLLAVDAPNYMSLNAVPDEWVQRIMERVANIANPVLRDQVTQMIKRRNFSAKDWDECQLYVQRISSIRKMDIDMKRFLDS